MEVCRFRWRRGRDSNSRSTKWTPVFKTGGFNRSPTPPIGKSRIYRLDLCRLRFHVATSSPKFQRLWQHRSAEGGYNAGASAGWHGRLRMAASTPAPRRAHAVLAQCRKSWNRKSLMPAFLRTYFRAPVIMSLWIGEASVINRAPVAVDGLILALVEILCFLDSLKFLAHHSPFLALPAFSLCALSHAVMASVTAWFILTPSLDRRDP